MRQVWLWVLCLTGLFSCSGNVESDGGGGGASEIEQSSVGDEAIFSSEDPLSESQPAAEKSEQLMPVASKADANQVLEQTDLTSDQLTTLQAADASDGVEDGVVSDCSRCAMMMPGDDVHTSRIGDYELHFCAAGCKAAFESDIDKGIAEIQDALDES